MKQWFEHRKTSTRMWLVIAFFGLLLLGGIAMFNTYEVDPALVKQNPEWLSNKTVTGELPDGSLVIENAVIKNATFVDFRALDSKIKNVVFEDCRFLKAKFIRSELENVTFKGDLYYESNFTDFSSSIFKNITMDGLNFGHLRFFGDAKGTRFLLKNMDMSVISYAISITDAHVRIKNCNIQGKGYLINLSGPGSVYATDSTFDGAGFLCRADVTYAENCQFLNGTWVGEAKTIVIKDSLMSSPVGGNGSENIYLINNTYTKTRGLTALRGLAKTKIYVDGRNKKNAVINILGGGAYLKDIELIAPAMVRLQEGVREPHTIDFNNVTIRGSSMEDIRLKGGRWQNVTIYPPVETINAQIKNVQTYNVKFPDGPPWTETDAKIELLNSPKPFDFPEIKAPTPQELGLVD